MKGFGHFLQRGCSLTEDVYKRNVTSSLSPELLLRLTHFVSQDVLGVTPTGQKMTACNFVNICSWLCIVDLLSVLLMHYFPCLVCDYCAPRSA